MRKRHLETGKTVLRLTASLGRLDVLEYLLSFCKPHFIGIDVRKNKPKLQKMSKAIKNKKTAFYNWKANGRKKDIHDPFLLEKKITTYELRKKWRKNAHKRDKQS